MIKNILNFLFCLFAVQNESKQKGNIKLSALVSDIRGKIGGTVFKNSASGLVAQNTSDPLARPKRPAIQGPRRKAFGPVLYWSIRMSLANSGFMNPDGSQEPRTKSLSSQQNIKTISKAWGQLLESDRAAWQELALTLKPKNKLGDTYTPSAYQAYMQNNLARLTVGLAPAARPSCTLVTVIDDDAQESMICFVCNGETKWCIYANDLIELNDKGAAERMQTRVNGNTSAFVLVFASAPLSPGRKSGGRMAIVAAIQPVNGYNNFLLRPAFNFYFGKNLGGSNIQYKVVAVSPGGSQSVVSQGIAKVPTTTAGEKIKFTMLAEDFIWLGNNQEIDFGTVASGGGESTQTILPYGIELANLSSYTIELTGADAADFSFKLGSETEPLNPASLLTDCYGNILPRQLFIYFSPAAPGSKTCNIVISQGSEILSIKLNGTAT